MSADADHWWRNRREASANSGDAWSGGAGAHRRWMGAAEPARPARDPPAPVQAPPAGAVGAAEPRTPPDPRPVDAVQPAAADLSDRPGPPNPRAARRRVWVHGPKRRGRFLGSAASGLAAVVLLAPLAWAGRWHPCEAAEAALVDNAIVRGGRFEASRARVANWTGPDGKLFSHGRVGRRIAAEEHVGWPAPVGCTALFWRVRSEAASFGGFTAVLSRALSARR